jgi:hypothetical protein
MHARYEPDMLPVSALDAAAPTTLPKLLDEMGMEEVAAEARGRLQELTGSCVE